MCWSGVQTAPTASVEKAEITPAKSLSYLRHSRWKCSSIKCSSAGVPVVGGGAARSWIWPAKCSGGRIGVRVASLVSYLRTTLRLPFRLIQRHLASLHSLRLSIGELVELTHAVRRPLQPPRTSSRQRCRRAR